MMAVEENDFQSNKTDASLYNGRPTDIGAQCHSVGAASRTSSISKYKDGVSVENVRTPIKQWFVLRVSYGRVIKAKEIIDACHIDCYAPMRHKQITKHGKKHIITEPLIPSFIFVHSSQEEVDAMLHDKNVNSIEEPSCHSCHIAEHPTQIGRPCHRNRRHFRGHTRQSGTHSRSAAGDSRTIQRLSGSYCIYTQGVDGA